MSIGSNITLADAQGTPVNHVFVWAGVDPQGVSHWIDRSSSEPIGYWRISMSSRAPRRPSRGNRSRVGVADSATGVFRNTITLSEPVLENVTNSTVSGIAPAPTVSYIPRMELVSLSPERGSALSRGNMVKMFANLLLNAQANALLENLDQPR